MRVLLKAALLSALLSGSVLAQVAAVELPLAPLAPEDPGAVVTSEYQSDAARLLRVSHTVTKTASCSLCRFMEEAFVSNWASPKRRATRPWGFWHFPSACLMAGID